MLQEALPRRAPLGFAYREVRLDHVLLGHDPGRHSQEVDAGMMVGWVHAPVALHRSLPQAARRITLTALAG
jgi:hypothetical protein